MSSSTSENNQQTSGLGIVFMLLSFVMYTGIDVQSKIMVESGFHPVFVTWGRLVAQIFLILPFIIRAGGLAAIKTRHPKAQAARGFSMLIAGIAFVAGLQYLPLATMTAINFVSPFMISILAVIILKEHVGYHRWIAIVIGFTGALVIIRPGTESFHPAALFAVFAASFWAMSVIATRMVQNEDSTLVTLFYTITIGAVGSSVIVWNFWPVMTWEAVWYLVGMALCSSIGQIFMIMALRHATASALAPLGYTQLIWATLVGALLFNDLPDNWTWAGAVIIVGSGIYVWNRERRAAAPTSMPVRDRLRT